ncbi:MAG: hypothetical protein K0Q68_1194 [Moraxellaceae bacterium]|jgi:hypothetical protein|nr:hypothetical protein [Moraxellaceae bacterium]
MQAVIVAMGLLMWIWTAASLQVVRALVPAAAGAVRSGWLALAVVVGAGLLLALVLLVLPDSILSQGWTRETLLAAQQWSAAAVMLAGAVGGWQGLRQLAPPLRRPAPPVAMLKQKRQP